MIDRFIRLDQGHPFSLIEIILFYYILLLSYFTFDSISLARFRLQFFNP